MSKSSFWYRYKPFRGEVSPLSVESRLALLHALFKHHVDIAFDRRFRLETRNFHDSEAARIRLEISKLEGQA